MPTLDVQDNKILSVFTTRPIDNNCLYCKTKVELYERQEIMFNEFGNPKRVCGECLRVKHPTHASR